MIGFIFLLILGIILETVFYPYPFTLLIVIMTVLSIGSQSLLFAFMAGLFLDLFNLKLLAGNSLVFLLVTAVMLRYNRRINFTNILNVLLFIVSTIWLYYFIFYHKFFGLWNILATATISLIMLYLLPILIPPPGGGKKLKV